MGNWSAYWRMPSSKELQRLTQSQRSKDRSPALSEDSALDGWWEAVLDDPRAYGVPRIPIQQRRLSEIPRELLRVGCSRCGRVVEIKTSDAIRFAGPHATWREVGERLLAEGCQYRTGRHEEDGCWADWR